MHTEIESLFRSLRVIEQLKLAAFSRLGERPGQLGTLLVIRGLTQKNGRAPKPSELSESTGVMPATVTAMLNKLELRALIRREYSRQDRREVFIRLTEQGGALCDSAARQITAWYARLEAGVGADELERFYAFARRIEEFGTAEAGGPPGSRERPGARGNGKQGERRRGYADA